VSHEAVLLDAGSLQDSLLNLVLNARDAIGSGSGAQYRAGGRDVQDTWLDITVTDTGPGFDRAALDHALDPFFTTKGEGGSGLGLSMVYDMASSPAVRCACRTAMAAAAS
jgi:signal transduction histidine kinase